MDYDVLNETLTALGIGRVDSKARGVKVDHKEIRRKVKGRGRDRALVVYTLVNNKPSAIIARYV